MGRDHHEKRGNIMKNTNTTTMTNEYANIITDNRFIASAQLDADDMGKKAWEEYRKVCDVIAVSAWRSLYAKDGKDHLGAALAGLFDFFGMDTKATTAMQKRVILACVVYKKEQSVAMKNANKALRKAKVALAEAMDSTDETIKATIPTRKAQVDDAQEKVDALKAEPNNVWYQKTPMLDASRKHATAKCRKLIEDTMADIIAERSLMTIEELQEEALQLKAARKARKQMKAQANATAVATTENAQ